MGYYLLETIEDETIIDKTALTKYEFLQAKAMHNRLKQKKERV